MKNKIIGATTLLVLLSNLLLSCSFFNSMTDDPVIIPQNETKISSLSLGKNSMTTSVGSMEYISVSVKPANIQKDVKLTWNYDHSIIECDTSSSWGVTIKAIAEGQTTLRCSAGGYDATCLITVSGIAEGYEVTTEPYIYSNYSILQTAPGVSEKVFVSLYGGDAGDIDGYNWSVDNSSIIGIQPTGQYCVITAKDAGYARIKITHPKATYPYYMGIYVFEDATKISYITTSNNIVTMNQDDGDKTISVSLVNGKDGDLDSQFSWEIIKENNEDAPVTIHPNGNNAVISPKHSGSCTIRITHPSASYPLDVLCRVITVVKNVYIQPDNTVVTISGNSEQTITSELVNIKAGEYSMDGFNYILDDYNVAEIVSSVGNQVIVKGIANGSCKLIISHERSAYSREVLLIVNGQLKDAVDASCYITTSQNYIKTKVGGESQTINISLKGGIDGDESGFRWSVRSTAADGSSNKVIELETATGSVFHELTRSAAPTYSYGTAVVNPVCEGTAVITISHPKIVYPTEILVKVLSKDAILEEPLYFTGSGLVKILNGESSEYTVQLKGNSKIAGDEQNIKWDWDKSILKLSPAGNTVNIQPPSKGTGCTTSNITVSHPKAENNKSILVMTADDIETLNSMKALYADKLYYNLQVGDIANVIVNQAGFDTYDEATDTKTNYDFSPMQWLVKDNSILSVEKNARNPLSCSIKALKSGQTTLTAKIDSYSCEFKILVYPEGAVSFEPEVYFTTSQNVISLGGSGKSTKINISAVNLPSSEYSNINWDVDDSNICKVIPNGTSANVTSSSEGETVIKISHPDSQNELKIYVRVGSEYVIPEAEPLVYISATDVMTFLKNGPTQTLQAILVNSKETNAAGFTFEIDNENIAKITAQTPAGIAYIKPVSSGQAQITITNTATEISKQVLVVVGNSEEELAGFTYLTTSSNVVSIGEGNTKTVSVSVKNADSPIIDGYNWSTSNPSIVDVSPTGSTALLKANSIGTALITITNKSCKYSLTMIVQVIDPIAASANPYIQLSSSVLTLTVGPAYTSLSADLIGGTKDDYSSFLWEVKDSGICAVYGQNEVGKLRALKAGQTYVTVSHPKANYQAQLLVVCEEAPKTDCYISVPSSIITMKPNASAQTITASLVNGSSTDKYNFSWSLDVYDIIDVQYSANVCTITPKQTGSATITLSHPKAAYSQQIIVNVQEYSNFAFPQTSANLTQGTVSFMNMQVPNTSVTTHVEYSVDNPNICSITGTKAVAQLTGVQAGTTTVRAKLVASSTGVTQAESEMLVYVKEAPLNAVFITSSSTIYTVNKGKSQTLSATLSGNGITNSDQYNMKWTTSDSDIVQVTGISSDGTVTGQSIYITALKPGEALITCSHEKAASTLQFYVVVPGTGEKSVTLNKSYITMTKGTSGTQLKATIENADGSSDYNNLIWTCEGSNGIEVARIMGNGQTVTIYPMNVGEATITCQHPDSKISAKCTILVEAGKSLTFETNSRKVQPFHSKKVKYKVSPPSALLTWTMAQDDDYFEYRDLGCDAEGNGEVEITGMKEGSGTLACVTDGSAKAQCSVRVAWDYEFSVSGTTTFSITPEERRTIEYQVSPIDSTISIESTDAIESGGSLFSYEIASNGDGTGKITILPAYESANNVSIKIIARNPKKNNEEVGSKILTAKFAYPSINLEVHQISTSGKYSSYNTSSNALYLSDGETSNLNFTISQTKSNATITSVTFSGNGASTMLVGGTDKSKTYSILNAQDDIIKREYIINKAYVPVKGGNIISNWETDMIWVLENCHHSSGHCDYNFHMASVSASADACVRKCRRYDSPARYGMDDWYCSIAEMYEVSSGYYDSYGNWINSSSYFTHDYNNITYPDFYYGRNFSIKEDPSLKGKIYPEEEFKKIGWFYCPGTRPDIHVGQGNDFASVCSMNNELYDMGACRDDHMFIKDFIMTRNVDATLRNTSDSSVKSTTNIGSLIVNYFHNGKTKTMQIPVYAEVRNCKMN